MKVFLRVYFILIFSFLKVAYGQNYADLESAFQASTILPNIHYGFCLYDLDKKEQVFGIRDNQYFTPASNTKVYTLFTSLKHIGDSIPGIQYVVRGDSLLFWGTGDPSFLHPRLDNHKVYDFLLKANKKLFYVKQNMSENSYRNGWSIEDYQYDYQSDISPFPIYGNLVRFRNIDQHLEATPSYFNQDVYQSDRVSESFQIKRSQYANEFEYPKLEIPKNFKTSKPFIWTDSLFVRLLQDTLHKEVLTLSDYKKPNDLKTVYSIPRNTLLREMMLPSDNFLAEQLTMLSSLIKYNTFNTDSLRVYMQKEYYTNFQDSVVIRDGSGLSTYNKITPRNMVNLLRAIAEIVPVEDQRFQFFPTGGIDGTLRSAYEMDLAVPFIWAKTGAINSVHCQSGYIETREGRRFAFSFLNNNYVVPTSVIRQEMVRIMTFIRQNY